MRLIKLFRIFPWLLLAPPLALSLCSFYWCGPGLPLVTPTWEAFSNLERKLFPVRLGRTSLNSRLYVARSNSSILQGFSRGPCLGAAPAPPPGKDGSVLFFQNKLCCGSGSVFHTRLQTGWGHGPCLYLCTLVLSVLCIRSYGNPSIKMCSWRSKMNEWLNTEREVDVRVVARFPNSHDHP